MNLLPKAPFLVSFLAFGLLVDHVLDDVGENFCCGRAQNRHSPKVFCVSVSSGKWEMGLERRDRVGTETLAQSTE